MATKVSAIESLQEAKERVRKAFRPSDEDPVVRFIGENGKMGLRHLMSEEVVEAPTQDFIEMPEAEEIAKETWEGDAIKDRHYNKEMELREQLGDNYKTEYDQSQVQYYPPFVDFYKFTDKTSSKMCMVNDRGEIVIPAEYKKLRYVEWFDEKICKQMYLTDVLQVCKDDENSDLVYGYVRLDGTEVVPAKYPSGAAFKEIMKLNPAMSEIPEWGYRWRGKLFNYWDEKTDMYGFQTIKGKKVTEPISVDEPRMQGFADGRRFFEVRKERYDDDIAGLVDDTGKEILPCKYDKDYFRIDETRGLIFARKKKKEGVFDIEGKSIVKCAYGPCDLMEDVNVFAGYTSKDVTLFNLFGQIIIDKGQYDKIKTFSKDGLLHIRSTDGKWWYIDLWGNKKQEK